MRFENEYYQYAKELENIAKKYNITIKEPYKGCNIGEFYVLSPSKDWHLYDLIPNSNKTSEIKTSIEDSKYNISESIAKYVFDAIEDFGIETLKDYGETSRENESSVILYANFNNKGILLTGEAGKEALQGAYDFALTRGSIKHHYNNMPKRDGWSKAEPVKFFTKVESYE